MPYSVPAGLAHTASRAIFDAVAILTQNTERWVLTDYGAPRAYFPCSHKHEKLRGDKTNTLEIGQRNRL